MITPELIAYIKQQLALGKTKEEIKKTLVLAGGWQEVDIEQGLAAADTSTAAAIPVSPAAHSSSITDKPKHAPSRTISAIVGIAIAILFNMFFYFSYQTLFKNEDMGYGGNYSSAMSQEMQKCYMVGEGVYTKDQCFAQGGRWNEYGSGQSQQQSVLINGKEVVIDGNCDLSTKSQQCQQDIQAKYINPGLKEVPGYVYNRNKFIAGITFGAIGIIIAMIVTLVPAIAIGLSLGGAALLVGVSFKFWAYLSSPSRVIIVLLALIAVIFFAWKKLRKVY